MGTAELWVMNSDGTRPMKLSDGDVSAGTGDFPQWSPDNTRIIFDKINPPSGIYDVSLRTGAIRHLAPIGFGIDVSPDGRQILFSEFQLYVMDANGQNLTNLTPDLPYAVQPAWSPDGKKIAFAGVRDDTGRAFIFVMNADGSNIQDITADYPDLEGQYPVWSPDGKKIAFIGIFPTAERWEIDVFVMNADGSGLVDVSNIPLGVEDVAVWSPNGKMLAFDSLSNAETDGLYTVKADGSNRQFVAGGNSPNWAPNNRIAFHAALDGQDNTDIYSVP
jgi:TolB protein